MDKIKNREGEEMLKKLRETGMHVLNEGQKDQGKGEYTYIEGGGKSTIDYVIPNEEGTKIIKEMEVGTNSDIANAKHNSMEDDDIIVLDNETSLQDLQQARPSRQPLPEKMITVFSEMPKVDVTSKKRRHSNIANAKHNTTQDDDIIVLDDETSLQGLQYARPSRHPLPEKVTTTTKKKKITKKPEYTLAEDQLLIKYLLIYKTQLERETIIIRL